MYLHPNVKNIVKSVMTSRFQLISLLKGDVAKRKCPPTSSPDGLADKPGVSLFSNQKPPKNNGFFGGFWKGDSTSANYRTLANSAF